MSTETRSAFHRQLDSLDLAVATLLGLVPDALRQASEALLSGDEKLAANVAQGGQIIEELYSEVDETIGALVATQGPVARDLRFLMGCLRLLPEVRDTLDLIDGVARPELGTFSQRLTPRVRSLSEALAEQLVTLWSLVDTLWRNGPQSSTTLLDALGDAAAEATSALVAEASGGGLEADVAVQVAVLTAACGRIAHHANAVGRAAISLADAHPKATIAP